MPTASTATIRYLPVGDSYTIGTGNKPAEAWPSLLTADLQREGVDIDLLGNPARNGWTTADAIAGELPLFERTSPTFGTLFIGVNDYVRGVDEATFRANLQVLMDRMLAVLPGPDRLVVMTIPDYSVTPAGAEYAAGRDVSAGLAGFNAVIRDEAAKRGVAVADFAPIADAMRSDPSLIAGDGLHPSAAGHRFWEAIVLPLALERLKTP